jgi:phenylacetate-CoA ligase
MGVVELRHFRQGLVEIVGTCLHNFAMPFIRYQTGDLAEPSAGFCPCGRQHPVLSRIVGREADFIVTPEGNIVSPLMLNFLFHRRNDIRLGQIIQEDLNFIRVKLVPWEHISLETKEGLVRELRRALESSNMTISVEEVHEIPRTVGCKRPFVISRLSNENRF